MSRQAFPEFGIIDVIRLKTGKLIEIGQPAIADSLR